MSWFLLYNGITFKGIYIQANLHSMLKRFSLNLKGLSDASAVSLTKKEYGSAVLSL